LDGGILDVDSGNQKLTLGEAATRFLATLPSGEEKMSQQEIYRFVRWYGWERELTKITPPEVASYAEHLSLSDTDYIIKLKLIRTFLVYAKKERWCKSNLATHLKIKKRKARLQPSYSRNSPEAVSLTQQGYDMLQTELATLKNKRSKAIGEIRRAAADKDFRENAPLEAAREQHSHLEGRIKEIEEALKLATVIDEKQKVALRVGVGDSIILRDLASGEELHYTIVNSREVAPARGKISSGSPIGQAVVGRGQGEVVEITVPAGKVSYRIEQVGR
jgi:transcription elongation factor GreA